MTNNTYNIDEEAKDDSFTFTINNVDYRMKYPTTEEIEKQSKLSEEELGEWMYTFITPIKEGDPPIKQTLKKVHLKKVQRFTKMIEAEFAG